MSITLDHSDFQCLQDQLVELRTKNYELAEKNRRGQADFEAAKAKICSLQLKLEEQERDFQVTSTTLRREIEVAYQSANGDPNKDNSGYEDEIHKNGEDLKSRYKKLLHKAKELQQRYEKSVEVVQQMDAQIKSLEAKVNKLDEANSKLKREIDVKQTQLTELENTREESLGAAIEKFKITVQDECKNNVDKLAAVSRDRDELQDKVNNLTEEVTKLNLAIESQSEERKIQERKGSQMVKELKRQLTLEKSRNQTLQIRLENLLNEPKLDVTDIQFGNKSHLSAASSTGNSNSNSSNGRTNAGATNTQDDNSVSSWGFVPDKTKSTLSICSIDSDDRETIQQPCDTKLESSLQQISPAVSSTPKSKPRNITMLQDSSYVVLRRGSTPNCSSENSNDHRTPSTNAAISSFVSSTAGGMLIEEQAALMERLTSLQHDKWALEEKLSYVEQANAALTEDLASKSNIIRNYFMDQAAKSTGCLDPSIGSTASSSHISSSRKASLTGNMNQLLSEKPSLKKVVDFLKERSQLSTGETEAISREATRKMQVMLEETLIKCLKLQENLDFVTSELNRMRR